MSEPKPEEQYKAAKPLHFWAEVVKVQTMESGACRITLDFPGEMTVLLAQLAECKRRGAVLDILARPVLPEKTEQKGKLYGT